jgi:hypothetical protein
MVAHKNKHAITYYRRHAMYVLLLSYKQINPMDNNALRTKEVIGNLPYGYAPFRMHLRYLEQQGLISCQGDLENIEDVLYNLTHFGHQIARVLKDIKYHTLYSANPSRTPHVSPHHTQTYYNRQALFILMQVARSAEGVSVTKLATCVDNSKNELARMISSLGRENEDATRLPLLKSCANDCMKSSRLGTKVVKILGEIKYQSLYNIGMNIA